LKTIRAVHFQFKHESRGVWRDGDHPMSLGCCFAINKESDWKEWGYVFSEDGEEVTCKKCLHFLHNKWLRMIGADV